jgi:hypothetical protein
VNNDPRQPGAGSTRTNGLEPLWFEQSEAVMAGLIAIGIFVAVIILLNIVEFGRPD